MIDDYKPFIEHVIERYEGGYGWDKHDPGGPTKFGITCYDLAGFYHESMDSMAHWASRVKAMTLTIADEIYQTNYANVCDFNGLGCGKDCVITDFAINSGTSRAIKFAQSIVRVQVDGQMGPVTAAAINRYESRAFINALCDARLKFLRGLGTWSHFGRGWAARVDDLRHYCLNLAYPPLQAVAAPETYVDKIDPIPLAFGKAY